jgi:hypothetical protein
MVRRRDTENTIPAHAYAAVAIAENMDRTTGWVVFKAYQLEVPANVGCPGGTDPGPAGFDWVEIDFRQTH